MQKRPLVGLACSLCALAVLPLAPRPASAQPKFEYSKPEEVKVVEWKASAQAGLILSSGNSRAVTTSAGATASRKAGDNKVSLELAGAYAKSEIPLAADGNGNGVVDPGEITSAEATTTKAWSIKARY